MRHQYTTILSCSAALLITLSACDQHGGALPLNGQSFLSSLDGPKIPTMQDSQLEAAKTAERNDDFAQASQIYQQILEKDPDTNDVVQLLADSLRRNGEYEKAISVYDGILAKDAGNLAAKEGKALAIMSKGDFETPTVLFEEVLKADGKRWKSLNGMGILFVTRGLYPDSMKYFEEALKQSPTNTSVMNNFGLSQALNKQYDAAIDTLSKASTHSTANSVGRKRIDLNLALVYASAGKLDEARRIASQYLSGPTLNNNLGLYAHLAKDDAMAKSYLNMALTESKTYYGKAWDNLEVLNSKENSSSNKDAAGSKTPDAEKSKQKKSKPKDPSGKITIIQEPTATKSEVKSIGEIIAHEIKDDKTAVPLVGTEVKTGGASPVVIVPAETKPENKMPAVENVIDDIAKPAAPKTVTAKKPVANSLGTIKAPATPTAAPAPANNAPDTVEDVFIISPPKENIPAQ